MHCLTLKRYTNYCKIKDWIVQWCIDRVLPVNPYNLRHHPRGVHVCVGKHVTNPEWIKLGIHQVCQDQEEKKNGFLRQSQRYPFYQAE